MSIKDRLTHTAALAKWKTDQQVRLLKSQNAVRELQNQINILKMELANKAIYLLSDGQSLHEDLNSSYEKIVGVEAQIKEQEEIQAQIRAEVPPSPQESPSSQKSDNNGNENRLVCPECKKPIAGKYCPTHGIEGVPFVDEKGDTDDEINTILVCPKCKKELNVRFCPEHGVEGVPKQEE